ncbi:Lactamase-B domain-containing protein [Mycena chlorophos]|uniref:Lactamase-B domain-containing protein n=1 Tax=Mycena chlorophos TaxID=658473 RepID=A0A8H6T2N8_MYCCL|nr:Lactamase-B domain-containing protein [Mycena chlorophos]
MSTDIVFLGTGTSSSVPSIVCVTANAIPGSSDEPPCRTCLAAIDGTPEGKKNVRRNTSIVFRTPGKDGDISVLIDCGKNFQAAALEWFPKYRLGRIDAVLITHAHSDAINGLDDLRAWTMHGRIQTHIDIYASEATYQEVKRAFPYMVSKEFASGGGDVPDFVWHIFEPGVPFEILQTGVMITPFLVQHGRFFTPPPPPTLETAMAQTTIGDAVSSPPPVEEIIPYMAGAFRIQEEFVYISDCGAIPDEAWSSLLPPNGKQLRVAIIDCLRLSSHASHFGLKDSIIAARRIAAARSYLIGFSHDVAHDEYEVLSKAVGGAPIPETRTKNVIEGMELIGQGPQLWVRPAHDGLQVSIQAGGGQVQDKTYS